jgi:lysophospholipase L1-like esterase
MVDVLMQDKQLYIADHLHPNDAGHERIFQLIKTELDVIIDT